jgi:predicted DNA-binding transcriptional regulator AlpA
LSIDPYQRNHKAIHESLKISENLKKLNKKYENWLSFVVNKKNSHDTERKRLSYKSSLKKFKDRIKEFILRYGEDAILAMDYAEKTITFGYKGKHGKAHRKIVSINPYLMEELNSELTWKKDLENILNTNQSKISDEEILRPSEAAQMLGVSYKTLWRWANKEQVKHIKLPSGRFRYYRSDIEELSKRISVKD